MFEAEILGVWSAFEFDEELALDSAGDLVEEEFVLTLFEGLFVTGTQREKIIRHKPKINSFCCTVVLLISFLSGAKTKHFQ